MALTYKFKDESLFNLAMTQSGVDGARNNERLEFVGDRVFTESADDLRYHKNSHNDDDQCFLIHKDLRCIYLYFN